MKSTLVILYFMHVKGNTKLVPVVILSGVFFLLDPVPVPGRRLRHARLARGPGALTLPRDPTEPVYRMPSVINLSGERSESAAERCHAAGKLARE